MGRSSSDSSALRNHGVKAILPDHYPERGFPVTYAMEGRTNALGRAAEADIDTAGANLVKALFDEAVKNGLGERYHPVIATLIDREQST